MPIHDWTLVDAGVFHHFHNSWLNHVSDALNAGILPTGFYALTEQHAHRSIAEVLALHVGLPQADSPPGDWGVAVAEAPPRVRRTQVLSAPRPAARGRPRTLVIRHVSGHRVVALLEVVSPANKDRRRHVGIFARKVAVALRAGVHVLVVDVFPPGGHDPSGIHPEIVECVDGNAASYELPPAEPLTFAGYAATECPQAFLEHRAVGAVLPEMPLFIAADRYVNVPLESTYQAAYRGVPAFYREILDCAR
jgi:hypothetical protein